MSTVKQTHALLRVLLSLGISLGPEVGSKHREKLCQEVKEKLSFNVQFL